VLLSTLFSRDLIYSVPRDSRHMDGYSGQPFVLLDDMFQIKDSLNAPNPELMQFIQFVNEARTILPMANLADKGTEFTSKMIVATSNVPKYKILSINDENAIWRRFARRYLVRVQAEFTVGGEAQPWQEMLLDTGVRNNLNFSLSVDKLREDVNRRGGEESFVNGRFYPHVYQFHRISSSNQHDLVGEPLSWEDVALDCCKLMASGSDAATHSKNELSDWYNFGAQLRDRVTAQIGLGSVVFSSMDKEEVSVEMPTCEGELSGSYLSTIRTNLFAFQQSLKKRVEALSFMDGMFAVALLGAVATCAVLWKGGFKGDEPRSRGMNVFGKALSTLKQGDSSELCDECYDRLNMCLLDDLIITGSQAQRAILMSINAVRPIPCVKKCWLGHGKKSSKRSESSSINLNKISAFTMGADNEISYAVKDRNNFIRTEEEFDEQYGVKDRSQPIIRAEQTQPEMAHNQNLMAFLNKINRNTTFLDIKNKEGQNFSHSRGVFICGQIMMVNKHVASSIKNHAAKIIVNGNIDVSVGSLVFVDVDNCDASLVYSPSFPTVSSLEKHFVAEHNINRISTGKLAMCLRSRKDGNHLVFSAPFEKSTNRVISNDFTINLARSVRYKMDTLPGYCGAPLLLDDPTTPGFILGIHAFGNPVANGGTIVTREAISAALLKFPTSPQSSSTYDYLPSGILQPDVELPDNNAFLFVTGMKRPFLPSRTDIRRSEFSKFLDCDWEIQTKPAHLKPILVNDEWVDPLWKGLDKISAPTVDCDDVLLECVKSLLREILFRQSVAVVREEPRLIPLHENVFGSEDGSVQRLDMNSSAGFPWSSFREPNKAGKRTFFDVETLSISEEFKQIYAESRQSYLDGKPWAAIFAATLKDERRPIKKVDAGKTRVFYSGPLHYTLLFREFFLSFMNHIQNNRIENRIGVGINCTSPEWHRLAQKLTRFGDGRLIAGDFQNFDGSMVLRLQNLFVELANEWYDDEYSEVRRMLWRDVTHSKVLVPARDDKSLGAIYQTVRGMASGCPATAIGNSVYNLSACMYVVMKALIDKGRSIREAFHAVRTSFYCIVWGDDNILHLAPELDLTPQEVTRGFEAIGMTYTDESKTGENTKFRSLAEVSFLKRSFRYSEKDGVYLAPLDKTTIYERLFWVRKSPDQEMQEKTNIEDSFNDLCLHARIEGSAEYDDLRMKVISACRKSGMSVFPVIAPADVTYHHLFVGDDPF
jgi:hypothetical protein